MDQHHILLSGLVGMVLSFVHKTQFLSELSLRGGLYARSVALKVKENVKAKSEIDHSHMNLCQGLILQWSNAGEKQ